MAKSLIVGRDNWKLNSIQLKKGDEFDPDFFTINRHHLARFIRLGYITCGQVVRDFETVLKENKQKKKPVVKAKRKQQPKGQKKKQPKAKRNATPKPVKEE